MNTLPRDGKLLHAFLEQPSKTVDIQATLTLVSVIAVVLLFWLGVGWLIW